ncbi:molybdopterin molybdotransferase MoeA [Halogeometricum borinquense]|uniref:Molybdopterin molybdotransferase MoeA n=1 Tax=Halogeometricum borinquense TaxID=60847 RepID=A0A6C0UU93_9EURY|nr:gephyrin-like molybdotransferase Glp [Halogeometricum borinquense]QIB76508.1 molybdopterin molybdotransferase MoeA [Halogeometricum borinquense]QIQ75688.1 molybdopterin molybdotransferase MoeA [Halogeometricum borinquense]
MTNAHDRQTAGFKERTRVADARETLLAAATPHQRTDTLPLGRVDGRSLAEAVTAPNPVPNYDRAAMDGWAVRAEDTFGASDRSPSILRVAVSEAESDADTAVEPGSAVRVHTGSELPPGADAVVMVEHADVVGSELEVFDAVTEGENVGDAGEDVAEGQKLFDIGHELRPSDLGLLKSVGRDEVTVYDRPTVGVIPTGEELVQSDPEPGEVVETNGLTVSRLVHRWGGVATYRNVVTDDPAALRAAVQRDLTKDVIVTTGGSSVGERDLIPEVVDELGEILVHGVALKPGHPVALGVVENTPVVMLPGYPVACIVNAVQFLRPLLKHVGHLDGRPYPSVEARLERKIPSEPGVRTFARVRLREENDEGDNGGNDPVERIAEPTRASGSGVLSSVALADGWVAVPEETEGYAKGETVTVEGWEWSA